MAHEASEQDEGRVTGLGSAPDRYAELPIPVNVRVGPGWTGQMIEMADHIGPYPTLLIVARFGGQHLYIPVDPECGPLREVVGSETAAILSRIYGRERFAVPVGRSALSRARRGPVLAKVRAGKLTASAAARMIGTARSYLSHLLNHTNEGKEHPCSSS